MKMRWQIYIFMGDNSPEVCDKPPVAVTAQFSKGNKHFALLHKKEKSPITVGYVALRSQGRGW
jgi:hypothetical protein